MLEGAAREARVEVCQMQAGRTDGLRLRVPAPAGPLAGVLLAFALATPTGAQERAVHIPRVTEPPVASRVLDGAPPPGIKVSGFRQREPGDGTPATVQTDVYLAFDQQHLYAVFVCQDDPDKVRANMTKREAIDGEDIVTLYLDTYHDGRRAYVFSANPLGIQRDGVTAEGQFHDDYSYDTVWTSAGRVTDDGFIVFMAIPFKSLRFSNQPNQTWGVAVARTVPRFNEEAFWPYITRRISSFGRQLAALEGLEGISPGRNLQAIPYGNFAADRVLGDAGYERDQSARIGIDGKAVIKDAVTLDLTVNPDFSQVESDEPQVTINQRFEVYFEEKRPFFIENASYFETPANLFFSRRIADPRFGSRVTGKAGGWAFGGLVVNDDAPGRRVEEADPRYDRTAGIVVARAQKEFSGQSHLGGIFTDREWGPSANRVYGADGLWRLNETWSITGQWIGSQTIDEAGAEATGTALVAELERDGRTWQYSSSYRQFSPDFRTDLGFIRRVDLRETSHEFEYSWYPEDSPILRLGPGLDAGALWDFGGEIQDWSVEPGFEFELPGQTMVMAGHTWLYERFEGVGFRRQRSSIHGWTEWLSWLNLRAEIAWGSEINYYPAEGLAPFLAGSTNLELDVTLKPMSRLRFDQSYLYVHLSTREGDAPAGVPGGAVIVTNHILRTRANYQFTRALSLRAILDYESVGPNQALVSLEPEKRLGVDLLATYLVNPWTAVYVGYSDAYENWRPGWVGGRPVERGGAPTTSVGRQVFVKLSYLFAY